MKRWYVVQVYAGYEEAIKKDIEKRMVVEGLADFFGEVLVPSAQIKELFAYESGDSARMQQQLFPGYILVEMELEQAAMRLVLSTPRVVRFLGGVDPMPLSGQEIKRILSQMRGEVALAPKKTEFAVGVEVEIGEGPFAGFMGMVDKVDVAAEKVTVMVSIFGRMTPIELSFDQVKH